MTTKKFANIEEARAKAEEVRAYLYDDEATIGENDNTVWIENPHEQEIIAEFSYEPEAPALVIGDWHRFWNGIGEDLYIGKLKDQTIGTDFNHPYQSQDGSWFGYCEPFDLVDPVEHKKLKRNLEALAADYEKVVAKNGELTSELDKIREIVGDMSKNEISPRRFFDLMTQWGEESTI